MASNLTQCSCRDRLQCWNYRHAHWITHVCHYSQLLWIVSKQCHASLGVWPAQHCSVMIQLWAVSQWNWLCLSVLSKKYVHVWTWQYYCLAWNRIRLGNIWSTFSLVLRFKQKLNEDRRRSFVGLYPQSIRNWVWRPICNPSTRQVEAGGKGCKVICCHIESVKPAWGSQGPVPKQSRCKYIMIRVVT